MLEACAGLKALIAEFCVAAGLAAASLAGLNALLTGVLAGDAASGLAAALLAGLKALLMGFPAEGLDSSLAFRQKAWIQACYPFSLHSSLRCSAQRNLHWSRFLKRL